MNSKESKVKLSEDLSYVLAFLRSILTVYSQNREMLSIYDKKTSDFNHALELYDLSYNERAKLATKQRDNLIERRKCKDIIYEYQPVADLLDSKEGHRFLNLLSEALGKVRKEENAHENRVYRKRISDDEKK